MRFPTVQEQLDIIVGHVNSEIKSANTAADDQNICFY